MKRTKQIAIDIATPESWPYVMTLKHIQIVTGWSKSKTLAMANEGELPARKIRGRWVVNRDQLIEWLKSAG